MNLEIPEGTDVQIIVGHSPLLAQDGEIIRRAEVGSPGCSHGALVKVFSVVALLGSGFLIGVLVARRGPSIHGSGFLIGVLVARRGPSIHDVDLV